jgi:predicted porin
MKKTQVALAALALVASTAALANGVNVYGNLEGGYVKGNNTSTAFSGAGQWGASVFGMKGSEDLGGGLTASFNLEAGIDTNTGGNNNGGPSAASTLSGTTITTSTALFNRAAWVAVGGDAGTLKLGNQLSPFILSYVTSLALAGNNYLVPVCVNANACDGGGANSGATGGFFIPNATSYSVSVNGISAQILHATENGDSTNKLTAGNLSFNVGPLFVTSAISKREQTYNNILVGGTIPLGDLKFAANHISHSDKSGTNADSGTSTLGVSYALSSATTVGLNYSTTSVKNSAVDPTLTNLSLSHALSKRTSAYAYFNKGTNGSAVSYQGGTTGATSAVGVGVAHAF